MEKRTALEKLGFKIDNNRATLVLNSMYTMCCDLGKSGFKIVVSVGQGKQVKTVSQITDTIIKARVMEVAADFKKLIQEPEPEEEKPDQAALGNLSDSGFENVQDAKFAEPVRDKWTKPAHKKYTGGNPAPGTSVTTRRPQPVATKFSASEMDTIKATVAKDASPEEFNMFMYLCDRYQLDPFLKEIFYSAKMKTIMTSRDGYLKIAQRDPDYEGIQSMAVCEGDEFELDVPNHTVKHKFGAERGAVIGAWAMAYRKGRIPCLAFAPYKEYYQANSAPWQKYKSAMCCKCAETFVLKRQFGISGLVTVEELGVEQGDIIDVENYEMIEGVVA